MGDESSIGRALGAGTETTMDVSINMEGFIRLMRKYRMLAVEQIRKNAGFSDKDVSRYFARFQKYDRDNSGDIANKELVRLLEEIFPTAKTSEGELHRIARIVSEIDQDGDGSLSFHDFLLLMRRYQDEKDEEELQREAAAIEFSQFNKEEVEQFRVIFDRADNDKSGELSLTEIRRMLGAVVLIRDEHLDQLAQIVGEVDQDGNRECDFPEFLRLMRRVQDLNAFDINEKAEKIAKTEEKRKIEGEEKARKGALPKKT